MRKSKYMQIGISLVISAMITVLTALGVIYRLDNILNDTLYQRPSPLSGRVVIIGIDAKSMDDIGPIQNWGREIYAMAVEALNSDKENLPAAIGIDVIFAGESDPVVDNYLAEVAAEHGNVVVAAGAEIGAAVVTREDGGKYMDKNKVLFFDEPYPALAAVADLGHVNAMYDKDGILRHVMYTLDLPDNRQILSFNHAVYLKYAQFHGQDGAQAPPYGSGYWYLPFSAYPGGFYDGVSLSDLLAGDVPSDYFAGKAVLIGPYAATLKDQFTVAIDHAAPMYGVEYQANAIEAFLAGNFKTEAAKAPQLAFLFAISFICLVFFRRRKMLYTTIAFIFITGGWLGLCLILYERGYVLHSLWIPLAVTIIYITSVAYHYVRASVEKHRITKTFKRYVAPEIVTEILKEGAEALQLGGKMTDIAVLFVDIRGFTPMSEALEPTQVVEILNRYLTLTSTSIKQNNGTLDKFVGDATMAFWGAPIPQEDYIFNAAKAALDMVEGSHALGQELLERFGRTVSFGIGVHCGKAVVGNIGEPQRMDYTAIGDTVNTAARLEANAPSGKILISRSVADALVGRISTTSLGNSIKLKGKSEEFEILTLDGFTNTNQ